MKTLSVALKLGADIEGPQKMNRGDFSDTLIFHLVW